MYFRFLIFEHGTAFTANVLDALVVLSHDSFLGPNKDQEASVREQESNDYGPCCEFKQLHNRKSSLLYPATASSCEYDSIATTEPKSEPEPEPETETETGPEAEAEANPDCGTTCPTTTIKWCD